MKIPIYQVDAFTQVAFEGNPAAVVPLEKWLPDDVMQKIAAENNLSETAFFIPSERDFQLRWFTPETEVNLCGHATLATAHVLFHHHNVEARELFFQTKSGLLKVYRKNNRIELDFPASEVIETNIGNAAGHLFKLKPFACFQGREDILFVFQSEEEVRSLQPDYKYMKTLPARGIIATAPSVHYDFVSRFFAPAVGIEEDPVTGSAHTMLIPYWAQKFGKPKLVGRQISQRGGTLYCTFLGDRVLIGGNAVTYMTGEIII